MKIINADVNDEIIFKNIEDVDTGVVTGITSALKLPTGNLNNILINFNFINKKLCEDLTIIANFNIDEKECIDVPLQSFKINDRTMKNACFIPVEVFLKPCYFMLGLYGFCLGEDGKSIKQRFSLIPLENIVVKGSYEPSSKETLVPTPTAFEIYFNKVTEANSQLDEIINSKTMYYKKYETSYTASAGATEIPIGITNFSSLFNLIVDKNGLTLTQGEDYTIDYDNTKIVLTTAVELDNIVFHFIGFATIIGTAQDMSDFINGDVVVADSIEWEKILNKPTTYNPPIASSTVLGGIKVGTNLTISEDGTLNAQGGGSGDVSSVNGKTGAVVLSASDIGAVATETGKGLSTNDYTSEEKTKLSGIEAGAEVNTVTSVNSKTGVVELSASDVGALPSTTTIPSKTSDLTNDSSFATETYVTNAIANAQLGGSGGDIDLSGYATKDDLNSKVDKVTGKSLISDTEISRLANVTNYDDTEIKASINSKANSDDIPTKTSDLTNDSGYITEAPVTSVNSKTGAVVLSASDVGAIAEPTSEGTNGQVLTTDGNGGRSWTTVSSGSSDCPITELSETLALVNGDNVANLAEGFYRTHNVTINGIANNYFSNSIIYIDRTSSSSMVTIENVAGIQRSQEALSIYNSYKISENKYVSNASCMCKSIAWNWVKDKPDITTQGIVTTFWEGTQSEYEALTSTNATTLYLIKEG